MSRVVFSFIIFACVGCIFSFSTNDNQSKQRENYHICYKRDLSAFFIDQKNISPKNVEKLYVNPEKFKQTVGIPDDGSGGPGYQSGHYLKNGVSTKFWAHRKSGKFSLLGFSLVLKETGGFSSYQGKLNSFDCSSLSKKQIESIFGKGKDITKSLAHLELPFGLDGVVKRDSLRILNYQREQVHAVAYYSKKAPVLLEIYLDDPEYRYEPWAPKDVRK